MPPRGLLRLGLFAGTAVACGPGGSRFVELPSLEGAAFVVSFPKRGGTFQVSEASFHTVAALSSRPQVFELEPGDERFWLVFDERSLHDGLLPRADLGDLTRLRLHPGSRLDCGPRGHEHSYDEGTGSLFRQQLRRLQPKVLVLPGEASEFEVRELSSDATLGELELELPARAEDCGLDAELSMTPFVEGGVFPETFEVGGRTVSRTDDEFTAISDLHPLDDSHHLIVTQGALYIVPRGSRYDPSHHPHLPAEALLGPPSEGASWRFWSALVERPGATTSQRILVLAALDGGASTNDEAEVVLHELAVEDARFGASTLRWRGDRVGLPGPLVRDGSGRILLLGRAGRLFLATSWDAALTTTQLGVEDLISAAVGDNPRFRHVLGARAGGLYWGDVFAPEPPRELVPRTPYTISQLVLADGPAATTLFGAWRDGRMFRAELPELDSRQDFELELPRRLWGCAGASDLGCGRRPGPRTQLAGLARLPGLGPTRLLALIEECSHPMIVAPDTGCVVALGPGTPRLPAPRLRTLRRFGETQWMGGREGQLYSIP